MNAQTDWWTLAAIVGLAGVTVLTRCFFFILDRPWTMPAWAHRALHYAPDICLAMQAVLHGVGRLHGGPPWACVVGAMPCSRSTVVREQRPARTTGAQTRRATTKARP